MARQSRKKSKKEDDKVSEDKSAPAENAEDTSAEATPGAEGPRWPLFYSQPVPLSIERHGDKSISLEKRFGFASDTNMVPVNMQEFTQVNKKN